METGPRVKRLMPIQRLPSALRERAVALATITDHGPGEIIYAEGSTDPYVHYLLEGSLDLLWRGRVTRSLTATNRAALDPLDPPGHKRYTVRTTNGAQIARFRRIALDRLIDQAECGDADHEFEVSEIDGARSSDWMIRMLQSGLFTVLPATNIQKIFARMEPIELPADSVVFRQGSAGEYYYVIEYGYCEVSRAIASGRGQIHLADLGPGTGFGEEALIADRARNATVTMVSDGRLMRLAKHDFKQLIMNEVLHPAPLSDALRKIDAGATWLDIRYPEDYAGSRFTQSENIPFNMLRLQSSRLHPHHPYVVCGDDVDECAIAAFLLSERAFNVVYLTETVSDTLRLRPDLKSTGARSVAPVSVVYLPGKRSADDNARETPVTEPTDETGPLDNTMTRIAGLYTHAEAQREMENKTPTDQYAETASGRELADIIDELAEQHDDLAVRERRASELERDIQSLARRTVPTMQNALNDGIGALLHEMEGRVREQVDKAVRQHGAQIEVEYREKLERMRELANQELAQRETALRHRLVDEYTEKEQLLRSYYKKLIALANNISRQKAQLVATKKQLENKLAAAEQFYRQVQEMRDVLTVQIGHLHTEELEEMPRLSLSM